MRIRARSVTAASATLVVFALATQLAAAASDVFRVEPGRAGGALTAASEGSITFSGEGGIQVICRLTLTGSLVRDIAPLSGAGSLASTTLGRFTAGSTGECRDSTRAAATVTILATREAPFELVYESFLGTLPTITGALFTLLGVALQLTAFGGVRCLYRGEVGLLVTFPPTEEATRFNRVSLLAGSRFALREGAMCPRTGSLTGRLRLTPAQRASAVEATMECRDERGNEGALTFDPVAPGGISIRRLTCTNTSAFGVELTVVAGSGATGANAAMFDVRNLPAVGELIPPIGAKTITIHFAPEAGAARRTPFAADFVLKTDVRDFIVPMRGMTT